MRSRHGWRRFRGEGSAGELGEITPKTIQRVLGTSAQHIETASHRYRLARFDPSKPREEMETGAIVAGVGGSPHRTFECQGDRVLAIPAGQGEVLYCRRLVFMARDSRLEWAAVAPAEIPRFRCDDAFGGGRNPLDSGSPDRNSPRPVRRSPRFAGDYLAPGRGA
jgi:hypothetical protein